MGAAGLESGAQETFWRTLGITDVSLLLEISGSASSLLRNGFPWWMAEGWVENVFLMVFSPLSGEAGVALEL